MPQLGSPAGTRTGFQVALHTEEERPRAIRHQRMYQFGVCTNAFHFARPLAPSRRCATCRSRVAAATVEAQEVSVSWAIRTTRTRLHSRGRWC